MTPSKTQEYRDDAETNDSESKKTILVDSEANMTVKEVKMALKTTRNLDPLLTEQIANFHKEIEVEFERKRQNNASENVIYVSNKGPEISGALKCPVQSGIGSSIPVCAGVLKEDDIFGKTSILISSPKSLEEKDVKEEPMHKPSENDCCTGTKKRKAGSVHRVSQSETSSPMQEIRDFRPEQAVENGQASLSDGLVYGADTNTQDLKKQDSIEEKGKKKDSTAMPAAGLTIPRLPAATPCVEEILKAISYTTTTINGKQQVLVLFKALRSDGQEVVVDNMFLRATYPLLLLDFYEQHLKYTTPTMT